MRYINSVFIFVPDSKIKVYLLNKPGTFHDSTMANYGMYDDMTTEQVYEETGVKVVVDLAFNLGEINRF